MFEERFNARVAAAIEAGTAHAPFPSLIGFTITAQSPGRVVARLPVRDGIMNGIGTVHGGAIVAMVDHVLSVVVYPLVEPGLWVATVDLKMNYVAPVRAGAIVAEATVLALGKRLGTVRIDVKNPPGDGDDGPLAATALGTVYVREAPAKDP